MQTLIHSSDITQKSKEQEHHKDLYAQNNLYC